MSIFDWALEVIGALFILVTWYLLLTNYWVLPEKVPVHYDFWGNPNIYSNKELIWLVPILMTAVYVGIYLLNKIPHLLNYPISVTDTNASKLYKINLRKLRIIRVLIAGQLPSLFDMFRRACRRKIIWNLLIPFPEHFLSIFTNNGFTLYHIRSIWTIFRDIYCTPMD